MTSLYNQAYEEMLLEAANAPEGWRLLDVPRCRVKDYEEMIEVIGESEYMFIAGSQGAFYIKEGRTVPCDPWVRSTLVVSPLALKKLRAYYLKYG